jgi:hypothetical protein
MDRDGGMIRGAIKIADAASIEEIQQIYGR